jgi:hypothetical protein
MSHSLLAYTRSSFLRGAARLAALAIAAGLSTGAPGQTSGSFVWTDQSGVSSATALTVHFRAPTNLNANTPVWFALHGEDRNAADYRNYLAASAAASEALIIAPEFAESQWPGSRSYNLGNVSISETNLTPRPEADWSFSKIEPLFDYVREVLAPEIEATSYSLYGHSAGAQFLHRFLLWKPEARVRVAVAANAGWYTLPTVPSLAPGAGEAYPYAWPYTLASAPDYDPSTAPVDAFPAASIDTALGKRLVVLLGQQDTLVTSSLRTTPEANAQGPHRLARGQFYYQTAAAEAALRETPFAWGLEIVPGIGHSGQLMAPHAAEWLRAGDAPPGDLNADGVVDLDDYNEWRDTYGSTSVPGLRGDATGDGRIDAADYTVWRDIAGPVGPGFARAGTVSIPEPSAVVSVLAAIAIASIARWRLVAASFILCQFASAVPAATVPGVVLVFGGDTYHGETYQQRYAAQGGSDRLAERGYDAPFAKLRPLLAGADLVALNLETALTIRPDSPLVGKDYYHKSPPQAAIASLERLGVGWVSLANNHAVDFGREGLLDTLDALRASRVRFGGAGLDASEAAEPTLFEYPSGSVSVAIVSAFEQRPSYEDLGFYATADLPGVNTLDPARLAQQVRDLKAMNPNVYVVASLHWGENYTWRTPEQRHTAERLASAGVDLIVGHGAHQLQEIERIGTTWVFYSLGNFVFQAAGRYERYGATPFSLVLRATVPGGENADGVALHVYPIHCDNLRNDYRPRPVDADEFGLVRETLLSRCGVHLDDHAEWMRDELGHCLVLRSRSDSKEAMHSRSTTTNQPGTDTEAKGR